jgi:hypothetical protein
VIPALGVILSLIVIYAAWSFVGRSERADDQFQANVPGDSVDPARPYFAANGRPTYVTFNSIDPDGSYTVLSGTPPVNIAPSERQFFFISEDGVNNYRPAVTLVAGKTYDAFVYFHNNVIPSDSENAIAHNTRVKLDFPGGPIHGAETATARISADNAVPHEVDHTILLGSYDRIIATPIYDGAYISYGGGAPDMQVKIDDIFGEGTLVGCGAADGEVTGLDKCAGRLHFKFKADTRQSAVQSSIRLIGDGPWQRQSLYASPGDEIEVGVNYWNSGTLRINDLDIELSSSDPSVLRRTGDPPTLTDRTTAGQPKVAEEVDANSFHLGNYDSNERGYFTSRWKVGDIACNRPYTISTETVAYETGERANASVSVWRRC